MSELDMREVLPHQQPYIREPSWFENWTLTEKGFMIWRNESCATRDSFLHTIAQYLVLVFGKSQDIIRVSFTEHTPLNTTHRSFIARGAKKISDAALKCDWRVMSYILIFFLLWGSALSRGPSNSPEFLGPNCASVCEKVSSFVCLSPLHSLNLITLLRPLSSRKIQCGVLNATGLLNQRVRMFATGQSTWRL